MECPHQRMDTGRFRMRLRTRLVFVIEASSEPQVLDKFEVSAGFIFMPVRKRLKQMWKHSRIFIWIQN